MAEHAYDEHEAAALRRERAGYLAKGNDARAKQVEDVLKGDGWPVNEPRESRQRRGGETGDQAEGQA